MDEEKRSNQNYEIIESCTIGSTELVIGHNPNSPNPYVCWYCKGGSNYFWGYYTNELDDKASPEVRKYIAQRAELLGAIRLPDNTFKANAGTEVTSDILILQKRDRVMDIEPDWVHLDTDENGVTMNRYFVEHPEMVLGEIKMENTRFGTFEPVCKARKDIPLSELLSNAVQRINGEIPELDNRVDEISDEQELSVPADPNVRNFSFTLVDGRVYFRENDRMQPASVSMTAENRIKGLIQIRDCVRKLIEYQTDDYPEEMIRTEQENLNRLYDVYIQTHLCLLTGIPS